MKHIINDSIFKEKLGYTNILNNILMSAFPDFFYIGSANLSNNIAVSKYINSAQSNRDNFNLGNGYMSDTINNDGPENDPKDPNGLEDNSNDLNKLDGIYD